MKRLSEDAETKFGGYRNVQPLMYVNDFRTAQRRLAFLWVNLTRAGLYPDCHYRKFILNDYWHY